MNPFRLLPLALFACAPADSDPKETGDPTDTDGGETDSVTDSDSGTDTDSGGTETDSGGTETDTATVVEPSIDITAPEDGATVVDETTLTWTVEGLVMDEGAVGGSNEEGHGHVHVYVDGEYTDFSTAGSYTISGLEPGEHRLELRLAANDHSELGPSDAVDVVWETSTPLVAITSPSYGYEADASAIELGLAIYDFDMSADVGGPNVEGEGHYHLYVDGSYFDYGYDADSAWVTRLAAGDHTVSVVLANNDHTEIEASDTIELSVAEGTPYVAILSPSQDESIDSSTWTIETSVSDFVLDEAAIGGVDEAGHGHYHVYVDDSYQFFSAAGTDSLNGLSAGAHTIKVVLSDNDHGELGSFDYVRASSPEDRPSIEISSPPEGEIVSTDTTVTVSVENFSFDESAIGGVNVEDEGHWHLYVDGAYYTYSATSTATVSGLASGEHTLTAYLANNDHSEVDPVVMDSVTVSVP